MKTIPQDVRLTQEIHARLVDIALNDPDREKRIAAADAERDFWNTYVLPIFANPEARPDMIEYIDKSLDRRDRRRARLLEHLSSADLWRSTDTARHH